MCVWWPDDLGTGGSVSSDSVVVRWIYPPIPDRRFDWQASRDGWDLGDPLGFGRTELEAIKDLLTQEEEQEDK